MPTRETTFSWSPSPSSKRLYGVRLGDTVITAEHDVGRLDRHVIDADVVRTLQSLRAVDPVEFGQRLFAARPDRAADR